MDKMTMDTHEIEEGGGVDKLDTKLLKTRLPDELLVVSNITQEEWEKALLERDREVTDGFRWHGAVVVGESEMSIVRIPINKKPEIGFSSYPIEI